MTSLSEIQLQVSMSATLSTSNTLLLKVVPRSLLCRVYLAEIEILPCPQVSIGF